MARARVKEATDKGVSIPQSTMQRLQEAKAEIDANQPTYTPHLVVAVACLGLVLLVDYTGLLKRY